MSTTILIPNITVDAQWKQNGVTVAGGHGEGSATNQLGGPYGLFVDDDQTMVIADHSNHRIIQWKMDDTNGRVVAGGNGKGNRLDQLDRPTDVLIDKETDSLIICDRNNRRVVRWSRRSGTTQGEILIDNIDCWGLAMDDQRYLYISDNVRGEVRRYQIGDKNGTLVAGGNGQGAGLNQLNWPTFVFIDQQQTVYVSDNNNHRVMEWNKGAKEGIVVAGGQGQGNALAQLSDPRGLFVDTLGTIYVADSYNHRVMRWPKGAKQGTVIVGGNGYGGGANQLKSPQGQHLVKHVISRCALATSPDDIIITALDAVTWTKNAWESVTQLTIRNTFRMAGFVHPNTQDTISGTIDNENDTNEETIIDDITTALKDLDTLLAHIHIDGQSLSASEFVEMDLDTPTFNEWNESDNDVIIVDEEYVNKKHNNNDQDDDILTEAPPKLIDAMEMAKKLHLLASTQYPELHSLISQLDSQLTQLFIDSKGAKQTKIDDFFCKN
ncbi:unnamed protein product [Rotaria sordida]|uniref:NHL repeat containing protein n=1 Tax=Rotaria sordida TaxID=392033 RepID=A0A815HRD8_9BILA|nr:unnamed protein product [Rotaria sordida]